jgi:hypothetical protein
MGEFYEYLWALAGYGKWLVTGGPYLVENVVKRLKPEWIAWLDTKISAQFRRRIEVGIVLIAVFLAGFLAWRDEHIARQIVEQKLIEASKPKVPPEPTIAPSKYVCSTSITAKNPNHIAMLFEFGAQGFSTSGFAGVVAIDQPISNATSWQSAPLRTDIPPDMSGVYTNSAEQVDGQIYRRNFASPNITPQRSEYFYIESEKSFNVRGLLFLESFDAMGDQVKANKMASTFNVCPR